MKELIIDGITYIIMDTHSHRNFFRSTYSLKNKETGEALTVSDEYLERKGVI